MALPTPAFAGLSTAQMASLDNNFAALGNIDYIPCTAVGTNNITLTPVTNAPTVGAYTQLQGYAVAAIATCSTAVNVQVGALASLPAYKPSATGPVALGNGDVIGTEYYIFVYDVALNAGNGGFHTLNTVSLQTAPQNANLFFSGPSSGAAAAPTFRALTTADFPSGLAFVAATISSGTLINSTISGGALTNLINMPWAGGQLFSGGFSGANVPIRSGNGLQLQGGDNSQSVILQMASGNLQAVNSLGGTLSFVSGITDVVPTLTSVHPFTNKTISGALNTLTNISGSSLLANTVSNSQLATMAATTIKGNNTAAVAAPLDLTVVQVAALFSSPVMSVLTGGSGLTYTTPANAKYLKIRISGPGGGGGGSGTSSGNGADGGTSQFGAAILIANGGKGGQGSSGNISAGGTASGGNLNITGGRGSGGSSGGTNLPGAVGGENPFGGAGAGGGAAFANPGQAGSANTGAGGGGASTAGTAGVGAGGGAGGYLEAMIAPPAASYVYTIGSGGAGGTLGTNGAAGGNGADGIIIVEACYQ